MLDDFDFFTGNVEGEIRAVLVVKDAIKDSAGECVEFS